MFCRIRVGSCTPLEGLGRGVSAGLLVLATACGSSPANSGTVGSGGSHSGTGNSGSSSGQGTGSGSSSGSGDTSPGNGGDDGGSVGETGDDASAGDSTGDGGSAGDSASGATGDAGPACAKTITASSQLVFLGDSYLNWGEALGWDTVVPRLETHLQTEGSTAYGASPRRYDVAGANMAQIASQYDTAHAADPNIDTIIMDGGGNDVLLGDRTCLTNPPTDPTTTCAMTIASVLTTGQTAMQKMQADGVKHIVYFFYPHVDTVDANGNAIGVSGKYANDTLDYAYPKVQALCASISVCVFVDTRPAWGENYAMYIDPQGFGVHPNDKGSQLLVDDAIWPAMVSHCVAQ